MTASVDKAPTRVQTGHGELLDVLRLSGFRDYTYTAAAGALFSVVSGGVGCLVVVALIAWRVPALRRYTR